MQYTVEFHLTERFLSRSAWSFG